jgi:hypothetical protein
MKLLGNFRNKGQVNIVAVVLTVVLVVAVSSLTFTFVKKTATEGSEKSADKVSAQDVCNDKIEVRISNVIDKGDSFDIHLDNTKSFTISDFVIRMEGGDSADVKKVKQILGSYESVVMNVQKPGFNPKVIKVIPRITLSSPDITSTDEGWWICSKQLSQYELA